MISIHHLICYYISFHNETPNLHITIPNPKPKRSNKKQSKCLNGFFKITTLN